MLTDAELAATLRRLANEARLYSPIAAALPAIERGIELLELRGRPMVHTTIAESCARSGCAVVHRLGDAIEEQEAAERELVIPLPPGTCERILADLRKRLGQSDWIVCSEALHIIDDARDLNGDRHD